MHHNSSEKTIRTNLHTLDVGSIVSVEVTPSGKFMVSKDFKDKEAVADGLPVDKPLYLIVDLYGRTKEVSWVHFGGELFVLLTYLFY